MPLSINCQVSRTYVSKYRQISRVSLKDCYLSIVSAFICRSGGFGKPGAWAPGLGHLWRSGPDLGNRWDYDPKDMGPGAVMLNYDLQQAIPNIACVQ